MKRHATSLIATVITLGLIAAFATPSYAHADTWSYDSNGINLDHGDVIIHGNDGTLARITPDGALYIAGKLRSATPAERQQLIRYVATVKDMQTRGLALGRAAAPFAASIMSDVLGAVFSGKSEDQIDKDANRRAHDFAQKALPICKDAQALKQIQDVLAASLPAFKPYAIIEGHDVNDCERDINSDD